MVYLRNFIILMGGLLSLMFSFLLYITFLVAFFSPGYKTLVLVNLFGEAWVEFLVIPLCLLCSCLSFYLCMKKNVSWKKKETNVDEVVCG